MPIKWHATKPAPEDPNSDEAEGHTIRVRPETEPAPDDPDAQDAEGHGIKVRPATEPAPDEPGEGMNPDEARGRT